MQGGKGGLEGAARVSNSVDEQQRYTYVNLCTTRCPSLLIETKPELVCG